MRKKTKVWLIAALSAVLVGSLALFSSCGNADAEPTPITYTISYTATEGGRIVGSPTQTVAEGESGDSVMAIAEEGYAFIGWSDGVQTAERIDEDVTADITVTAQFEKIPEYTLTYSAQTGGTIQGNASQTVLRGEDGTTVTAVAEEGYEFIGWSDGVQNAERIDENVTADITVTAQFRELDLPAFAGGNGTPEDPYQINTVRHLRNMRQYPAAHYILTGNIALASVGQGQSNFTPLFDDETMFTGTFDGNGYTISNLTIYNTDTFYTGLFACIGEDGAVFDLTLENVHLQGTNYIGGVAGYTLGAITNCKVTGQIICMPRFFSIACLGGIAGRAENDLNGCTANINIESTEGNNNSYAGGIAGTWYLRETSISEKITVSSSGSVCIYPEAGVSHGAVGGLFGEIYSGMNTFLYFDKCFSDMYVAAPCVEEGEDYETGGFDVGGLIGRCSSFEIIDFKECWTSGNLNGIRNTGGLIGILQNQSQACMENCYTTGTIRGDIGTVGGLIGSCGSIVLKNSYTTGKIISGEVAGGLIGSLERNSSLTDCYATGDIVKSQIQNARWVVFFGGLVGRIAPDGDIMGGNCTFQGCYANGEIILPAGEMVLCGGLIGLGGHNFSLLNCYANKQILFEGQTSTACLGGLVGQFDGNENTIENSYSTSEIVYAGTADTAYLGGLVGYAGEVTLTNVHWLYFAESGAEYAVGYSGTLGIPTNIGATKHTDIAEFYDLADTLNEGLETPAWEHTGTNTLPTLIKKKI